MSEILKFLSRVVEILPDVLISEQDSKLLKHELVTSLSCVIEDWDRFYYSRDRFFESWSRFVQWWDEFHNMLIKIRNSESTIFLSMN